MNDTELLAKVGQRIKAVRISKKMTQNDLAIECNFEKASMSRIESGQTNPTLRTLLKISTALQVNITDFFID